MEDHPSNTERLLPSSQTEEVKQQSPGYLAMFGAIAQQTAVWTAGQIKKGAELIETQLKDPELGQKIKQGTVDTIQWTKDKFEQAKQTVQDPDLKEKFKKTVEETGQSVKQGVDVIWEDLKKGAATLKKELDPNEKTEEDDNKKRVFDSEGPTPPAASLQTQMFESMEPAPRPGKKEDDKDDQLFNPFAQK